MGRHVTMWLELLGMTWVLSHPRSHVVEHAQQHSIIRRKWNISDWVQAGPAGTRKLREEWPECYAAFLSPARTCGLLGIPYD